MSIKRERSVSLEQSRAHEREREFITGAFIGDFRRVFNPSSTREPADLH